MCAAVNSSSAAIKASGTKRPPYGPKCPSTEEVNSSIFLPALMVVVYWVSSGLEVLLSYELDYLPEPNSPQPGLLLPLIVQLMQLAGDY